MSANDITGLLTQERIACRLPAASKKRAIEACSNLIATSQPGLLPLDIFDNFVARERLGSTGLGHGVAIPHARMKNLERAVGAVVSLPQGIDFDAIDGQPVDLLFALLVPEESRQEHLEILAELAEMFQNQELLAQLRAAMSSSDMQSILVQWQRMHERLL